MSSISLCESLDEKKITDTPSSITLNLTDQKTIDIPRCLLPASEVLSAAIDEDPTATVIPLRYTTTTYEVMQKVLEFLEHNKSNITNDSGLDAPPVKMVSNSWIQSWPEVWEMKWVADLHTQNASLLGNVVQTSVYLSIKRLMHLCSAYIAYLIKGKSIEEVKQLFKGIFQKEDNPFTQQ